MVDSSATGIIRILIRILERPRFYLLDSVSKNLGAPYTVLFSSFISRNKMEEMLVTWRTSAFGGVELFGATAQLNIQGVMWGDVASGS